MEYGIKALEQAVKIKNEKIKTVALELKAKYVAALESLGMNKDVVELRTGRRGIIEVSGKIGYISYYYIFSPYTKSGDISKKHERITSYVNLTDAYKPLSEMTREDWQHIEGK
jgi:hypothetical protein